MANGTIKKKILLLGDGSVGKTSLISKFVLDQFDDRYITTIGTKVTKKEITVRGPDGASQSLVLMIWDILGQKGFTGIQTSSAAKAAGVLYVTDITRADTLPNLEQYWMPIIKQGADNIPQIFLGNKADLAEEAKFGISELKEMAERHNGSAFLTSAKTGQSVDEAFLKLGEMILANE